MRRGMLGFLIPEAIKGNAVVTDSCITLTLRKTLSIYCTLKSGMSLVSAKRGREKRILTTILSVILRKCSPRWSAKTNNVADAVYPETVQLVLPVQSGGLQGGDLCGQ